MDGLTIIGWHPFAHGVFAVSGSRDDMQSVFITRDLDRLATICSDMPLQIPILP